MRAHKLSTLSLAVIAAATCAGCASYSKLDSGTTLGKIEVSGVRVSSRERMVNERLKRREFLESQLTAVQALSSTDFATDGGFSIRSVSGFGAGLGVSLDAGAAQLAKLGKERDAQRIRNQQEMDTKDQEILLALRDRLLADVKSGKTSLEEAKNIMAALTPTATSGSKASEVESPDPTTAAKWRTEISNLLKSVADLPPGLQPAAGKASPIDLFRDKLALLEEIRSEMAANELDDRHDLYGSTLVRLSVDATLIPDDDTSAWGVVEMRVKPIFEEDAFKEKWSVLKYSIRRPSRQSTGQERSSLTTRPSIPTRSQSAKRAFSPRRAMARSSQRKLYPAAHSTGCSTSPSAPFSQFRRRPQSSFRCPITGSTA